LHKLDSYHEALICYRQAAKSGYDGHVLKLFSGICAFSAGYLDEAEASLWQYLGDHPQDAVGLYYMGALEYIRMDNKLSVHYLEMALAIHPEYVDALYLMGANMMERRKYNQAAFWFEKSAEGEDAEPRSALNLALVRIELMDYSGALEILLSLDQSSSDFLPEVLYYLGEVHFALKNHDEACNYWSMASSKGDVDAERNYRNICEHNKKRLRKKRRSYSEF
jgi:tetratricopeptide (TPR) repeat protein